MRRTGLVAAWVVVTAVTTLLAWQIVAAADEQVNDRPLSVVAAAGPTTSVTTASSSTTLASIAEASTTTNPTTPSTTTMVPDPTSTTTSAPSSPSSTAGTPAPSTSTTTTTAPMSSLKTISTSGGTIVVSYRPGEARLEAASPAPGFTAEVEKSGPPKVEVEFESSAKKVEIQAEWKDGDLHFEVEESDSEGS